MTRRADSWFPIQRFSPALTSPFLLAICGYLLCYTALSTALYFQQVDIVRIQQRTHRR